VVWKKPRTKFCKEVRGVAGALQDLFELKRKFLNQDKISAG
jgi:hypothetical protein